MIPSLTRAASAAALTVALAASAHATPTNPCAAPANPCGGAMNPCAAPANPCGGAMNPCAAPANPCGGAMNPCAAPAAMHVDADRWQNRANVPLRGGNRERLIARGEALFKDTSLSGSGAMSCATCHADTGSGPYAMMNATFARPYPHYVAMADQRSDVQSVSAAEMVQFCQLVPMQGAPLAWDGKDLAALTAYVESVQPGFRPAGAAPANPCAGRPMNPCGG
jgi:cytochrome c